jgi:hypothetical protein
MKFALTAFPKEYTLPGRPSAGQGLEAYKQTQFLLGDDLALFQRSMNVQLRVLAENAKARTTGAAALMLLWSRTFAGLAGVCELMCGGSYVACPPLLRASLDGIAAQRSLIAEDFRDFVEWAANAVSQAKEHQALAFDLGRYRAGSVLAKDEQLGATYRLLTDLSMPHFGSTAIQVAPEAGLERMPIGFADTSFHLGWAELTAGWLLLLAEAQLDVVSTQSVLGLSRDVETETQKLREEIVTTLASNKRCRTEEVDGRFLFLNFRRTASGQPKRVIL